MFSWTLFKQALKSNFTLWFVITLVTTLFFNATLFAANNLADSGNTIPGAELGILSLLDQTFFSMIGLLLPLIYTISTSNQLLASEVDHGSLAFVLTTPSSRRQIFISRGIYLFLSLTMMFTILTVSGVFFANALAIDYQPEVLVQLMVNLYLLELSFASITYFSSAFFNKSSYSIGFGGGLTLGMFLMHTIGSLSSELTDLKSVSLVQFFDVSSIIENQEIAISHIAILLMVSSFITVLGYRVFNKKNLPL